MNQWSSTKAKSRRFCTSRSCNTSSVSHSEGQAQLRHARIWGTSLVLWIQLISTTLITIICIEVELINDSLSWSLLTKLNSSVTPLSRALGSYLYSSISVLGSRRLGPLHSNNQILMAVLPLVSGQGWRWQVFTQEWLGVLFTSVSRAQRLFPCYCTQRILPTSEQQLPHCHGGRLEEKGSWATRREKVYWAN